MFSKMIAGLRTEAEKVSEANCLMLANSHEKKWVLENEMSGRTSITQVRDAGALLSGGGVLGLMGLTMANQAAGTVAMFAGATVAQTAGWGAIGLSTSAGATTTMLAGASTALASLGTVAVGAAVLPVATVVVLGAMVAGLGTILVSQLMQEDQGKAATAEIALGRNDHEKLSKLARENIGITDWLKGAKNFVLKSLRQQHLDVGGMGVGPASTGVGLIGDASQEYELEDLLANSFEESEIAKHALVDNIGANIWAKLGVVVTEDKIQGCLSKTRENIVNCGKILGVDLNTGLVIQSLGRGQATVHNLKDFEPVPVVGQDMTISYKGGKIQNSQGQGYGKTAGVSVGR